MGNERIINGYKLEICSNSPTSALAAQQGGASRVELCQNLEGGGTTPSHGQIKLTRSLLDIGVHVLIRPRVGDFLYSELEFEEMKQDVLFCKEVGCDGIVIGLLDNNGNVDRERTQELADLARPMCVVFHRAFDLCKDPFQALEDIIEIGCQRILTSGQQNTALQGKDLIKSLVEKAVGRIEIMPGAGVNGTNVVDILTSTGAQAIHSSAKTVVESDMAHVSKQVNGMNEPVVYSSGERVRQLVERIQSI